MPRIGCGRTSRLRHYAVLGGRVRGARAGGARGGVCFTRDQVACVLGVHHVRERKTGPCFPLTVLRCVATHGMGFTLYPPGHVPYGRVRVAPVAPDGRAIEEGPRGAEAFEGTIFEAALCASRGKAWDRESAGGSERWWGTQWRRLAVALRICGLVPGLSEAEREVMAAAAGVALLLLREQARAVAAGPGYRRRGQAVEAVLGRLAGPPCTLSRLMAAGHRAGLWGSPLWWDGSCARLRSWSFPGPRAAAPR